MPPPPTHGGAYTWKSSGIAPSVQCSWAQRRHATPTSVLENLGRPQPNECGRATRQSHFLIPQCVPPRMRMTGIGVHGPLRASRNPLRQGYGKVCRRDKFTRERGEGAATKSSLASPAMRAGGPAGGPTG